MTFKKCMSIILISIMFYSLSGYGSKNILVSNNSENNKKMEITINPEISEYSPSMSSTPGIPLTVEVKKMKLMVI